MAACPFCGMKIVTAAELDADPWAGCTGEQEWRTDPWGRYA